MVIAYTPECTALRSLIVMLQVMPLRMILDFCLTEKVTSLRPHMRILTDLLLFHLRLILALLCKVLDLFLPLMSKFVCNRLQILFWFPMRQSQ